MTASARPDETELIRRFRNGDEEAFQHLIDGCRALLEARVRARLPAALNRRVSVADVAQDTLLVAFERRGDFRGEHAEALRNWLLGIAENKARRAVQRHRDVSGRAVGREVSRGATDQVREAIGREDSPSQLAAGAELVALARRAMADLPDDYREVLRLVREEGLNLREVGERMGRTHPAMRKLHGRALLKFTELFARLRGEDHER